jgi:hypothetical protein
LPGGEQERAAKGVVMQIFRDWVSLPRIDQVPSTVATTAVARGLAGFYETLLSEPLPCRLAAIIKRLKCAERLGKGAIPE